MSNKSGASEQIISLPKGGGALKGIGETFSPDLHTGAAIFAVPVALLPGVPCYQSTGDSMAVLLSGVQEPVCIDVISSGPLVANRGEL